MLKIRCKVCNKELESHPSQTKCCGCPNMTSICGEKISGVNLSDVIIVDQHSKDSKTYLKPEDLAFQEARKNRKVRKLDFEIR
ncbi:hypothetical protein [Synechococcus phage DSL-LC03]|nr:hypothetical protein [Synechococcus phage DSL-LC03]